MRRIIVTIFKVLIVALIVGWICIIFADYFKVTNGDDPMFCIKEETKKYSDGVVHTCLGLGYKSYRYERKSISAIEFGPFFIKEKQSN